MEQLQEIYCWYTETLQAAKKKTSPFAGILGTGGGLSNHPCHTEFYEKVGCWAQAFWENQPDAASLEEACRFLLMAGGAHKNMPTYWFVCAAQAHAKPMIPMLAPQVCAQLMEEYNTLYPAASRLPLSQEIYTLLCTGAGIAPKKKSIRAFFHK